MRRNAHGQRGQTIPVWTFGIMTTLMLMTMIFNYANSLRWQIRAQNASDSVAQAILSVQTQHYNQMIANLHASAIEEWRIRRVMQGLLYVLQGSGGCTSYNAAGGFPVPPVHGGVNDPAGWVDCAVAYNNLRTSYADAVTRYTQDVQTMQALSQYSQTQQLADMTTIANSFENNCATTGPTGADCAFTYTIANPVARTSLSGALSDAAGEENGNGLAIPGTLVSDLDPLEIEVVACAQVVPPFGSFFHLNATPFYAIGRSAATSTMVTQEWFAPGVLTNPYSPTSAYFNPPEFPENANAAPPFFTAGTFCTSNGTGYDWYAVHYCSNTYDTSTTTPGPSSAPTYTGYFGTVTSDEISTWTGWWAAVPIPPYNGTFAPTTTNCPSTGWNHS